MNSCLYDCSIYHDRLKPKHHRFQNRLVFFYLDLDELDQVSKSFRWLSRGSFNLYTFRDEDHLDRGGRSVRENVEKFAAAKGVDLKGARICLLTNLRSLGYYFNPVSFYFCFDRSDGTPLGAIAEVTNTFLEMKLYWIPGDSFQNGSFKNRQPKYFYISPFIALDAVFDFSLGVPAEHLDIKVNDMENGEVFFRSGIAGERIPLTEGALLKAFMRHPVSTLKVITLIHLHALLLYWKGVPHIRKEANPDLQREVDRDRRR